VRQVEEVLRGKPISILGLTNKLLLLRRDRAYYKYKTGSPVPLVAQEFMNVRPEPISKISTNVGTHGKCPEKFSDHSVNRNRQEKSKSRRSENED